MGKAKKAKCNAACRAKRAHHAGKARAHKRFAKLCKKYGLHSCHKRHAKLHKKHAALAKGKKEMELVQDDGAHHRIPRPRDPTLRRLRRHAYFKCRRTYHGRHRMASAKARYCYRKAANAYHKAVRAAHKKIRKQIK